MNLWNIYAKYYDALRSNPISSRIHQNEQNSLQNLISMLTFAPKSGHALDLGCGSGVNLHYIPDHYSQIVALDKSAEMVAITKNKYASVKVTIGDVCETPYPSNSMDLILCIGVAEYVQDFESLIYEISRLLSEMGSAIITTSPPGILNQMRRLLGHRLYLKNREHAIKVISKYGFTILKINHTILQDQYLLINNC